jgi:hypothetical protein
MQYESAAEARPGRLTSFASRGVRAAAGTAELAAGTHYGGGGRGFTGFEVFISEPVP